MIPATALPRIDSQTVTQLRKPDFFIVGAPKCGTTAMAQYLAAHPDIYMAKKEMHVFGSDLHFGPRFYRRDHAEYLAEYATWSGQQRAGEASVWYLFSTQAATEMRHFNPESKIIIMLREPVEMMYSLYHQFRFDGNEQLGSFEAALAAEPDRRAGQCVPRRSYFVQGLAYRDAARYTDQVRRYFKVFGRERVQVITYDDFAADPSRSYEQALEFLGVRANHAPPTFDVVNGNKSIRSRAIWMLLSDPWLRSMAVALRHWLPRPVLRLLYRTEARLWALNTRYEKRPSLSPELRARLRREFAPEVERLSQLLGRDLTHWSR
jgi:hypothetical protein